MSAPRPGARRVRGWCAAVLAGAWAVAALATPEASGPASGIPVPAVMASAPHQATRVAAPADVPAARPRAASAPGSAESTKTPAAKTPVQKAPPSSATAKAPAPASPSRPPASAAATAGKPAPVVAGKAAAAPAAVATVPAAASAASAPAVPSPAFAVVPVPADPCEVLVRRMPNLSASLCAAAQLQATGAKSVNGFPLYQRDVSARFQEVPAPDGAKPPRRPRVLVIGGIHGDELSSTSLVFHWIAHAMETGADMDWRFLPATNPDGLLQARPSRTNARGVDLNRNFPTPRWAQEAPEYWAKRTKKDPRRFPGTTPLSEPETRFLNETMDRWKPDLIVSVHAPYGVLDYDGPSIPPERLGRLFLDRVGIFPGSLGHYGGVHRGVPVVTIELPSAIRTPTNAEMRQMWIDLLRWIGERLSPPAER